MGRGRGQGRTASLRKLPDEADNRTSSKDLIPSLILTNCSFQTPPLRLRGLKALLAEPFPKSLKSP